MLLFITLCEISYTIMKNIGIEDTTHERLVKHCGKKLKIGAYADEAINEKLDREGIPTLDRQREKVERNIFNPNNEKK